MTPPSPALLFLLLLLLLTLPPPSLSSCEKYHSEENGDNGDSCLAGCYHDADQDYVDEETQYSIVNEDYQHCEDKVETCKVDGGKGGKVDGTCKTQVCSTKQRPVQVSETVRWTQFYCRSCPQGKWTAAGSQDCTTCSAGKYSVASAGTSIAVCKACNEGKYAAEPGSIECLDCDRGKYAPQSESTGCLICTAGKYTDSMSRPECDKCDGGKYLADAGTDRMLHNSQDDCTSCGAGKFAPGNVGNVECEACEAGKRSNSGASECTVCGDGKYSEMEWSYCVDCAAGKYSFGEPTVLHSECTVAPAGGWTKAGADEVSVCEKGEYNDAPGQDACLKCPVGKFLVDDETDVTLHNAANLCLDCPAGKFEREIGSSECDACDVGTYSSGGASACSICQSGKYSGENQPNDCIVCEAGKIAFSQSAECTECSKGKFNDEEGLLASRHAQANDCEPCPVNSFSNTDGATSCTGCASGSTDGQTGATGCTSCGAGKSQADETAGAGCVECGAGKYSNGNTEGRCEPCPAGRYGDEPGMGAVLSTVEGALGWIGGYACKVCPAGQTSVIHVAADTNTACVDCAAGKYSKTDAEACTECVAGKFSAAGLAATSSDELTGNVCTECPVATYSGPGTAVGDCVYCDVGKYNNGEGKAECLSCDAGQYSSATAADRTNCEKCEAAKYNDDGGGSLPACSDCPVGKTSNAGDPGCYKIADTFDVCEAYDGTEGGVGSTPKKNKCHYLYAGHWVEYDQGDNSPFGVGSSATCDAYTLAGMKLGGQFYDDYYVMCFNCTSAFVPTAFNTDIQWTNLLLEDNADVAIPISEEVTAGSHPSLCYNKAALGTCVDTKDPTKMSSELDSTNINCEYLHEGIWKSVDAGSPSPFGDTCIDYTVCGFEQIPISIPTQPIKKDIYKIQCDFCTAGNVGGLFPQGDNGECKGADMHPSTCYDAERSFAVCPNTPSSSGSSSFLPSWIDLPDQICKYYRGGGWDDVDAGTVSPFGSTCKTYEFCGTEQDTYSKGGASVGRTTYKIGCSECSDGYLPSSPKTGGLNVQGSTTACNNEFYPGSCYKHMPIESDWSTCPESDDGQDVECNFWYSETKDADPEWEWANERSGSPFYEGLVDKCRSYVMCHSDIEGDMEKDEYWLACTACSVGYWPAAFKKPIKGSENDRGSCAEQTLVTNCEVVPTSSPTPAPTVMYIAPVVEEDDEGEEGGGSGEGEGDGSDEESLAKPQGLVTRLKTVLGEHTKYAVAGFIAFCVLCGYGCMRYGCSCCGGGVDYDDDDNDSQYDSETEYSDDETRDTSLSSKRSYSSSGSESEDEGLNMASNPMRGGGGHGLEMSKMEKGGRKR